MKQNFFTDETRALIKQYITANQTERNKIFNALYPTLCTLTVIAMKQYNIIDKDEVQQDTMIRIYTHILPTITLDKVITAQSYIYNSIHNHIKNILSKQARQLKTDELTENINTVYIDSQEQVSALDARIDIIRRLDVMIRKERYLNRPNTIFLIELKMFLLNNNFDAREFNVFICNKMNISNITYSIICSRLKIKTKLLNTKLIEDKYLK